MNIFRILLAILTTVSGFAETLALPKADIEFGEQIREVPESLRHSKFVSQHYALFIPQNYGIEKAGTPLIIYLHGAGQRGSDITALGMHGIPGVYKKNEDFPFIALAPQCQKNEYWNPDALKTLIDHVTSELRVDTSRIYLTGQSMGGFGSWALAARYPDTFAAVAPICGGGNPDDAAKLKDIPIWTFHGDIDKIVPIEKSQVMVDALKEIGGNIKFTIYPGVGHNSAPKTYRNEALYDWFLSHSK